MTEESAIPARVRELLRSSIRSIEELELLLVLRRPVTRSWSAEQLGQELRLPEPMVVTALQALVLSKLAIQVGERSPLQYRYRVQEPEAEQIVGELMDAYTQHRLEVLMQISSNAIERVREGALRTFSDAFRWPGRKRDG